MKRRPFTTCLGLCVLGAGRVGASRAAGHARPGGPQRIGWLSSVREGSDEALRVRRLLHECLRRAGYDEGRNLFVERRYAEGDPSRLPALAQELVKLDVDLIIAVTHGPIAAARHATNRLPIVMLGGVAPADEALEGGMAPPGGNVTGIASIGPDTASRMLQLLKEAAPAIRRVAVLLNAGAPGMQRHGAAITRMALALGLYLETFEVARVQEVAGTLRRLAARHPDALVVVADPVLQPRLPDIVAFARRHRLVSLGTTRQFAEAGGMLYFGPDQAYLLERTVVFADRILKGAKPQDLAVEPPAKYELIVNLATAQALRHVIPAQVLMRASEVVE